MDTVYRFGRYVGDDEPLSLRLTGIRVESLLGSFLGGDIQRVEILAHFFLELRRHFRIVVNQRLHGITQRM